MEPRSIATARNGTSAIIYSKKRRALAGAGTEIAPPWLAPRKIEKPARVVRAGCRSKAAALEFVGKCRPQFAGIPDRDGGATATDRDIILVEQVVGLNPHGP